MNSMTVAQQTVTASFERDALADRIGKAIAEADGRVRNATPLILQRADDPNPAQAKLQAKDDMDGGSDGLAIVFEGAVGAGATGIAAKPESLKSLLSEICGDRLALRIEPHQASRASADWLIEILSASKMRSDRLDVSFGIDPSAVFAATGGLRMSIEAMEAAAPQLLAYFFSMDVPGVLLESDGRPYHNAGAGAETELGVVLAVALDHLRMFKAARQPVVYGVPHIGFSISVDDDVQESLARMKALRLLWADALKAHNILDGGQVRIHAETSYRMMSAESVRANIARKILAASAAFIGGATTLTVLPVTTGNGLANAMSREVSRILPSTLRRIDFGSFDFEAVDARAEEIFAEAKALAAEIEGRGGVLRSLASGFIQARIAQDLQKLKPTTNAQADAKIGQNLILAFEGNPNLNLSGIKRLPDTADDSSSVCEPLRPVRLETL
ncbi:methylmalonyl-CoA mutase family protein [Limoniibacter endophyticus]|uniref:Methylmalonyl-CoA mutase n=1 Tax=Limoniibacter endophyticus TaxID=1565040 RepID=A0A8J3DM62_9HYPH|nr:methylmalonyl-CoA mutase family protein [Limoniibacter endophyticus]GHC69653.1 methylmalonyl-CoA mutase [Limoniibacter endophyticus]